MSEKAVVKPENQEFGFSAARMPMGMEMTTASVTDVTRIYSVFGRHTASIAVTGSRDIKEMPRLPVKIPPI